MGQFFSNQQIQSVINDISDEECFVTVNNVEMECFLSFYRAKDTPALLLTVNDMSFLITSVYSDNTEVPVINDIASAVHVPNIDVQPVRGAIVTTLNEISEHFNDLAANS